MTHLVNKRETARARKRFGDDAIAYTERSHRFDKGKLYDLARLNAERMREGMGK